MNVLLKISSLILMSFVAVGCSGRSAITLLSGDLSSSPGTLSVVSAKAGAEQTLLTWDTSSGATSYTVRYGTSSGSYTSLASTSATSPYAVKGLTAGVTYYFMVTPNDGSQTSSYSEASAVPASAIVGSFVGAIGNFTGTTGTCPVGIAATWCTGGYPWIASVDGAFKNPATISIDTTNNLMYIADQGNHRISKYYLSSGVYIGSIGLTTASTGTCPASGVTTGWCTGGTFTSGSVDGSFNTPRGLAIDVQHGFLYTLEQLNPRVQKFNLTTGAYVGSIGKTSATTGTCPAAAVATTWCTGGTFTSANADGAFGSLYAGIVIDPGGGILYVADNYQRIQKFNLTTGAFIGAIGKTSASSGTCPSSGTAPGWCTGGTFAGGSGDGQFNTVFAMTIDLVHGYFYVTEQSNRRVQRFVTTSGASAGSIGKVGGTSTGTCVINSTATGWCTGGAFTAGSGDGQFNDARGIAIDPNKDRMYVGDYTIGAIESFVLSTGAYIGSIGRVQSSSGTCPTTGTASTWCTAGGFLTGYGDGQFSSPSGMVVDLTSNYLYIVENGGSRINRIQ